MDDAEQLCDCQFSLAYGNKVLLNQTKLKLKRGYRYGLCGQNDSGKTSLMRAIANQLLGAHKIAGRGRPLGVEGLNSGKWALVDMGDVLVHVFDDPWRGYYDLDGLWMDAPRISMGEVGLTEEGLLPRPAEVVEE